MLKNGGFLAHRNHQGVEMSQKSGTPKMSSERIVKDIRRATRKQYSAEENPHCAGWPAWRKASRNSAWPTFTSAAGKPSCWNEKGSNEPPSKIDACNTN